MAKADENELTITRIFDAPRDLLWKAWTEPERVMRWWGPKGFTSPVCKIDLRIGGSYLFCMLSPDGEEYGIERLTRVLLDNRTSSAAKIVERINDSLNEWMSTSEADDDMTVVIARRTDR